MTKSLRILTACGFLAVATASAQPTGGTINLGDAAFTRTDSSFDGTPLGHFVGVTSSGLYQTYEVGWWFRDENGTQESPFGDPTSEVYDGSTSQVEWTDLLGSGLNVIETVHVEDAGVVAQPGDGGVLELHLAVNNPTLSAKTSTFFFYADIDLGGPSQAADDQGARTEYPALIEVSDLQHTDRAYAWMPPGGRFQVSTSGVLSSSLNNSTVTTLNNGGTPFGPGDLTLGYSFELNIEPSSSASITIHLAVNFPLHCGPPVDYSESGIFCDSFESNGTGFWSPTP